MAKTILEIGFGPTVRVDAGIEINLRDRYVAMDAARLPSVPGSSFAREIGLNLSFLKGDGLKLPLAANSVDHVVMHNVVSEDTFPNSSMDRWTRKKKLTFRQGIELLESETHRVTKPGATMFLNHDYLADILKRRRFIFFGKTRLDEFKEVFGKRWHISIEEGQNVIYLEKKAIPVKTMKIWLKKK